MDPINNKNNLVPIYNRLVLNPYANKKVRGFVVNVHDAMNFDIDINIPDFLKIKYQNSYKTEYFYKQYDREFMETPFFKNKKIYKSYAYRCRIKGLSTNKSVSYNIINEIKQLFDRLDGKVYCVLNNIDIFNRILVDIYFYLPEVNNIINLKDYLLSLNLPDNPFSLYKGYKEN